MTAPTDRQPGETRHAYADRLQEALDDARRLGAPAELRDRLAERADHEREAALAQAD